MRYKHTGNVHKDFHLATDTTIKYVIETYDRKFLEELFRRTAQRVYREIYEALVAGEYEPLLEHWCYYYDREEGRYSIERSEEGVDFLVQECPAVRHVRERNGEVAESFYLQFELLCKGFSEGTPFDIEYDRDIDGDYAFRIRRRKT